MHIANQHESFEEEEQESPTGSDNINVNLHASSAEQINIMNDRDGDNSNFTNNTGPGVGRQVAPSSHGEQTGQHRAQLGRNYSTSVPANINPTRTNHVSLVTSDIIQPPVISPSPPPTSHPSPLVVMASIHSLHPQHDLKLNTRFMLMPSNDQIRELQTVIRDKATARGNFKFYADRLIRLVVEEGLNQLPIERVDVQTPTGNTFNGIRYLKGNCGVSIVRSGESMEQGLRDCCRSIRIGKILIESDENNQARVLYTKFPRDIAERKILLLYPIMSTGLAVNESVKVLLSHGVREDNLILLNLFSSPRAAKMINNKYPKMFVLTSDINAELAKFQRHCRCGEPVSHSSGHSQASLDGIASTLGARLSCTLDQRPH